MNKFIRVLMSVSFVLCAFLSVVDYCCFDKDFYETEQEKYKIGEYIGIESKEDMKTLTDVTVDYLRDRDLTLDLKLKVKGKLREVYNEKEKSHMEDVRNLYLGAMNIRNISLIITICLLAYSLFKKTSLNEFYKSYSKTLICMLLIFGILGFFVYLNFDEFWYNFHFVFFDNMNWLLDGRTDILVMFVPGEFFNDLVVRIIVLSVIAIIIPFAGLLIGKKYEDKRSTL